MADAVMEDASRPAQLMVDEEAKRKAFLSDLDAIMKLHGTPITSLPQLAQQELDLYMLYNQVTSRGGIQMVLEQNSLQEIANALKLVSSGADSLDSLRIDYLRHLYYYEQVKFFGIKDPPPPPLSLGPIPISKNLTLLSPVRSPPTGRRRDGDAKDAIGEADGAATAQPPSSAAPPQVPASATPAPSPAPPPRQSIQPLSMPIFQPAPNVPLGAPVVYQRTGLEALPFALKTGPDFLREWAMQVLLTISLSSDVKLSQVPGLLTALASRIRTELEGLHGAELSSPGLSLGWPRRQAAQRLSVILRNIALIADCDADMAAHPPCVLLLLQLADCPDDIIRENTLDTLAAIASFLSQQDAAAALPHLLRALRSDPTEPETFLHAILQLSISPKLEPSFLLTDTWRAEVLAVLADALFLQEPGLVLIAIQTLYNLSVAGGTLAIAQQNPSIVRHLARFIAMEVRGTWRQEEIARKSALLLLNFSKAPGTWHQEMRRHEADFVTGACVLGASPTATILFNLVNNLAY